MCHLHREMIIPASKVASTIKPIIVNAIFDKNYPHRKTKIPSPSYTRGTISMGGTLQSPLTTETYLPAHTPEVPAIRLEQAGPGLQAHIGWNRPIVALLRLKYLWLVCLHVQFGSPTRAPVSMTDIKGSQQVLRVMDGDFFWGFMGISFNVFAQSTFIFLCLVLRKELFDGISNDNY